MALARSLQDRLDSNRIVIMDGGTGTEISRRGVTLDSSRSWSANPNITSPDLVRDIHRDYILAGAEIIITNTFSTSRATLATDGLSEQTEAINKQSVRLAIDARKTCDAEETVVIAGSMSAFEPKGHPEIIPSYEEALEDYREQVKILAGAGVDLIVLEMFSRTVDLKAAIGAAMETDLPVWVGLSCERHDGQIYLGVMGRHVGETIADAVIASSSPNVKAFCIMHSPPQVTADALRELKIYTSLPIGAYAHGGRVEDEIGQAPKISQQGRSLRGTDPEKYLDYAHEWVACGATIIGGCCGTTPEHIRVLTASNLRDTNG
ncbi:homocysteine S-methyltransferase family protein [SAR202 cluster bacterium AC-647-N09_OGT_505m]|nr:homocysteine S-methyltransferase family protein [SAR202 cluster bacterium AC-647-N09_OGT_505m]